MSDWTHAICETCWFKKNPGRIPTKLTQAEQETCCYCGQPTTSGIYLRDNPKTPKHCKHATLWDALEAT